MPVFVSAGAVITVGGLAARGIPPDTEPPVGTAPSVADGQTWVVDDTVVDLDGSASGDGLTFTHSLVGAPEGVTIDEATGAITGTPTEAGSGTVTIVAVDQFGVEYTDTFTWTAALRTQATAAGGLGPFSFAEDVAITTQDLAANFTSNGNTLTFAIAPALPVGLSMTSAGSMSGTPTTPTASASYTISATDEYGRVTSTSFTLAVTGSDVTAPSIYAISYANQTITAYIEEASGAVTVVWASADPATDPTYEVGVGWTGTIYESGSFPAVAFTDTDQIALTATTPDGARELTVYFYDASGNLSPVSRLAVTVDTTAPVVSTAATNTAGTAIVVTMSEPLVGTADAVDWTVEVDALAVPVSMVTINLATVTVTVSAGAILNGDTVTVSYSGGDLADAAGNALATITDRAVTNNVPASGVPGATTFLMQRLTNEWGTTHVFNNSTNAAIPEDLALRRFVVCVVTRETSALPTSVVIGGVTATLRQDAEPWQHAAIYDAVAGTNNDNIVVNLPTPEFCFVTIYETTGEYKGGASDETPGAGEAAPSVMELSLATTEGWAVVGCCGSNTLAGITYTGVTQRGAIGTEGSRQQGFFDDLDVAGGAPETFQVTLTGGGTRYNAAVLAAYG
jgi:hypothetical protein